MNTSIEVDWRIIIQDYQMYVQFYDSLKCCYFV